LLKILFLKESRRRLTGKPRYRKRLHFGSKSLIIVWFSNAMIKAEQMPRFRSFMQIILTFDVEVIIRDKRRIEENGYPIFFVP